MEVQAWIRLLVLTVAVACGSTAQAVAPDVEGQASALVRAYYRSAPLLDATTVLTDLVAPLAQDDQAQALPERFAARVQDLRGDAVRGLANLDQPQLVVAVAVAARNKAAGLASLLASLQLRLQRAGALTDERKVAIDELAKNVRALTAP